MATALSDVDICNMALDLLRQNASITSIDDPSSDVEDLAARWYDTTRQGLLRSHPWNFARKRILLSRNSTDPISGYPDAYNLPVDFLRLLFIGDNYNDEYEWEYSIEGGQILIDNEGGDSLEIGYIYDMANVPQFDPLFKQLLAVELAVVFANAITGINKGLKDVYTLKKELEMRVRAINGQENPVKVRYRSTFIGARRNATRSGTTDGQHLFVQ